MKNFQKIKQKGMSQKSILIIAIAIALFLLLGTAAALFLYFKYGEDGGISRDLGISGDIKKSDKETRDKIKDLEDKIKELEEKQQGQDITDFLIPPLSQEEISAVVELWCPDDNYDQNGFVSMGSGTIVGPEGIIFTNRHVVSNEDWSMIESSPTCYVGITEDISQPSKFKYMADLVAYVPSSGEFFDFDVAVLYIFDVCHECPEAPQYLPSSFPYLELGYSSELSPGDYIAIAGYPAIGAGTFNFTDGIISGRVGDFVIKTDAKIDSGNSGGAALNAQNLLVGIPTWTMSGQAESMGYIIGINPVYDWFQEKVLPLLIE